MLHPSARNLAPSSPVWRDLVARGNRETRLRAAQVIEPACTALPLLVADTDAEIRLTVLTRFGRSMPDLVEGMATDADDQIRATVARMLRRDSPVLERMAGDPSAAVRLKVAECVQRGSKVLEGLARDADSNVRKVAGQRWECARGRAKDDVQRQVRESKRQARAISRASRYTAGQLAAGCTREVVEAHGGIVPEWALALTEDRADETRVFFVFPDGSVLVGYADVKGEWPEEWSHYATAGACAKGEEVYLKATRGYYRRDSDPVAEWKPAPESEPHWAPHGEYSYYGD